MAAAAAAATPTTSCYFQTAFAVRDQKPQLYAHAKIRILGDHASIKLTFRETVGKTEEATATILASAHPASRDSSFEAIPPTFRLGEPSVFPLVTRAKLITSSDLSDPIKGALAGKIQASIQTRCPALNSEMIELVKDTPLDDSATKQLAALINRRDFLERPALALEPTFINEIMEILLMGADPDVRNKEGNPLLTLVVLNPYLLKASLDHGADATATYNLLASESGDESKGEFLFDPLGVAALGLMDSKPEGAHLSELMAIFDMLKAEGYDINRPLLSLPKPLADVIPLLSTFELLVWMGANGNLPQETYATFLRDLISKGADLYRPSLIRAFTTDPEAYFEALVSASMALPDTDEAKARAEMAEDKPTILLALAKVKELLAVLGMEKREEGTAEAFTPPDMSFTLRDALEFLGFTSTRDETAPIESKETLVSQLKPETVEDLLRVLGAPPASGGAGAEATTLGRARVDAAAELLNDPMVRELLMRQFLTNMFEKH